MKKNDSNTLANILFPTEEQDETMNSILQIPPEQRRLITETYDFTVSTLLDAYKLGNIFIPKFQRAYIWTDSQASRLIESLIIQCPIPVIYLSQEKDEKLAVIDGNQRINSLNRFLNNEFSLIGLTAYPELEGNHYFELDPRFQRHIANRTLRCLAILKETHPQVKFDVFERLNTGSAKLSFQELRHALHFGPFMQLAEKLAKNSYFKSSVKVLSKRMKHEELIIRYFALKNELQTYAKPLSNFLNTYCDKCKNIEADNAIILENDFNTTLEFVDRWFGEDAFKVIVNGVTVSRFNAALYDAVMVAASQVKANAFKIPEKAHNVFMKYLENNEAFKKAIAQATSDETQVQTRITEAKNFFEKYTK